MDAFVLVREASLPIVQDLRGLVPDESNPVRFVTPLSGRHDALVVLEVDSLGQLQDYVLETIHGERQLSTETAVSLIDGPLRIKRVPPSPVECFVRIRVERGRAAEVMEVVSAIPGYRGSAVVAADFDVLLELGGETFEEVAGGLLQLHMVEGIVASAASFAALEKTQGGDGP
ncbi:MAG: hypothetical protein H0W27_02940 [Actinobacteria bacterium]|nr:hypothetical protein [Actinomycetota bacterium]